MKNIRNFCIIAHIDHGKSTLADRFLELTGTIEKRKMQEQFLDTMELERERGITIKLQPVRMDYTLHDTRYTLNLIDTPGHVDFSYEVSRSLAAVEGAVLLVDATKGVQAQTLANLYLAQAQGLAIIPVINKIDLPNARVAEVEEEIGNILLVEPGDILHISAKEGTGVAEVLEAVIERIPPPALHATQDALRALIFDSAFDIYKGVLAYIRVFEGTIKAGDKIRLFASEAGADVIEVGIFTPALKKGDELSAGDIGYVATGLKNVGDVRVGDTVMDATHYTLHDAPLPGYKEPRPVVFASFYPEEGEDYDNFRDALGKLKLTDASLLYEPESSPALGRGFRLGFLGMLHVEIISERLRREFKLSLIISTPSVEYHVRTKRGEDILVRSAALLPDPSLIEILQEPRVNLEILSPATYLGQLMKLMTEYRSEYRATDYLTKEIVILKYTVPLAEIITDFYDRLKSVSSGYASMSYEPAGYQASDLVRLDILVADELVEPFSKIVPRELAYQEGKRIVEKLKVVIPRQWFAVSLQAAIGGKIIARETISALRKDVTGYLYGGDITRKKKLLEKQKRGKKRMQAEGHVEIPQEVFLEMLKK
ncbi:MAG: elongation factor 4 [Candidatus Yanofskybacteria bacterium RIFCSPLOWO2_01_FULL_49_25]|uniref:Elongation factor 4 n=1 Tax=Candidatus Yanofskybacteria bacterium RIFCSPLOWO2_01_FULL_49_25 TaxID=1802701 RepID=A0A1F8GV21_9BACT|nr:MAG: elongation factor 4 [Candidatus Yanofskybacteria bacterium RIFCSPLOWO2_01_FULL_49_25]